MDGSSLTMSVPNIITSNPGGGRFDFDDGGTYCGGWQDGKAHGHGVCTGPKNVGEYSGSWNFGFEMSGVYKWTNGAVYEGRWQHGKRHGVGVEYNGKWVYKGEWSQGFKGRYGVKASLNSAVKYEGTWANGLQDGYGSETYSDGGYYQGHMCRGLRHGYGVRKSAPYGDSQLNNPNKNGHFTGTTNTMLIHSNSLQSAGSVDLQDDTPKPEDGFKPNIDRTLASKNGFVLVAKPLEVPMSSKYNNNGDSKTGGSRRSSLTNRLAAARIPGSNQTASLLRGLGLRKQKSTSDLDAVGGHKSQQSHRSAANQTPSDELQATIPFTLSPEELDITDPTTVETYTGEWKHDKRNGHGVCDRSDGLKYEGQWHNDMKSGYGVTTFKDGTKEEGKYKNNILIADSKVKRFFQLGSANIRLRIDEAVKMAQQAQTMALKKAEIADTRAATARDKADQANTAAIEAARDSEMAYAVARQYSGAQQSLPVGVPAGAMMGVPSSMGAMVGAGMDMMLPSLSMGASPLQMRRISQQQQQQQMQAYAPSPMNRYDQTMDPMMQDRAGDHMYQGDNPQSQMQQQQQQPQPQQRQQRQQQQEPYLGPVEPFNGRRGSFRSGSQPPSGTGSGGGGRVGFATNNPASSSSGYHSREFPPSSMTRQPSASDPFNDLFDHYKSSQTSNYSNTRRRIPGRQASLDYNQMWTGGSKQPGSNAPGSYRDRMRQFRMSSMDHAEENHQSKQRSLSPQGSNSVSPHAPPQNPSAGSNEDSSQQFQQHQNQLRHLVTSGEEMVQRQPPAENSQARSGQGSHQQDANQSNHQSEYQARGTTPTSASYILPASANSSMLGQHTPSPDSQSFRPPSSQFYGPDANQPPSSMASYPVRGYPSGQFASHLMRHNQRDVHSLADEQLYISAGRRAHGYPLDRGEFSNYDFAITSGPRMAQRCIRRTASLSRQSSVSVRNGTGDLKSQSHMGSTMNTVVGSSSIHRASNSPAPLITSTPASVVGGPDASTRPFEGEIPLTGRQANLLDPSAISGSRATLDSAGSSGPLARKTSLQVRYDPAALGGLMSREEVAALSHAQREQKRVEHELAERRAKRPLLHLYLSLCELLSRQKLLITVLVVNVCLFKMFADLIS